MTNNYLSGDDIKTYILDPKECVLCRHCNFPIEYGGYCPQYDCWATDKVKKLSERQWDNIAKKLKFTNVESIDEVDVWEEVRKKRVRK